MPNEAKSFPSICAVRLASIRNDRQTVLSRDFEDRRHIRRLAIQVHRHNRFRPRRNRLLDQLDVNQVIGWINVDEHGRRPGICDRERRRHKRVGSRDHFIARPDPERTQCQMQRLGTIAQANAVPPAAEVGERLLKRRNLIAENILAVINGAFDRDGNLSANCFGDFTVKSTKGIVIA